MLSCGRMSQGYLARGTCFRLRSCSGLKGIEQWESNEGNWTSKDSQAKACATDVCYFGDVYAVPRFALLRHLIGKGALNRDFQKRVMNMREAVIVSSVRTPVGKAFKGTLRSTRPDDLAAIAMQEAIRRVPGLNPAEIEDVILGCAMPEGEAGMNVARIASQRAGLPAEVPAITINRFCSSGLQSIAMAAERIMVGHADVILAGGTESMSMIPMGGNKVSPNPWLMDHYPDAYLSMGLTAENVAKKYGITREKADEFSLASHKKALAAIAAGKFKDEIVPVEVHYDRCRRKRGERAAPQRPKTTHDAFRDGRRPARRHQHGSAGEAQARISRTRHDHGGKQFADQRWRRGHDRDERRARQGAGREAPGAVSRICHGRSARRNHGHRPGVRDSESAEADRA